MIPNPTFFVLNCLVLIQSLCSECRHSGAIGRETGILPLIYDPLGHSPIDGVRGTLPRENLEMSE